MLLRLLNVGIINTQKYASLQVLLLHFHTLAVKHQSTQNNK